MTRELLERFCFFLIPFALYFAYIALSRTWPPDRRHPWMLLTIAGLSLVALSFAVWGFTEGEPTTGLYVAPHVVNGKVVPGYVKPAAEKQK